ncbi:MAG TPA: hypothetical protein EYN38_04530 [Flavobacteriales bacterium]|nr:hypothetical protein [Flavobacteriales bacterium]HIO72355.1 hypothetical protein [Flavobacteriales bacterium]
MSSNSDSSNSFDASGLVAFLYVWRKPLIIVSVAAAILSAVFSAPFFIKPKYESRVILFPGSTSSISKAVLNESAGIKNDILEFGEEEQVDQLLQILNSDDIKFRIISKYNLMSHYDIDADGSYPITKLNKEYDDNISFRRTEFMSIEIKVLDIDPDTAAMIANDISNLLDTAKNRMQKDIAVKAFEIVKTEYDGLTTYIASIKDSLKRLGMLGVHDYKSQSEVLNRQYAEALAKDNQSAIKTLTEKLDILAKYGSTQMSLAYNLENIYEEVFPIIKRKYDEAKVDATETLPHKFVVNRAYPAEKKSYPIRWLIVLISTLSAFMLAALVILIRDNVGRLTRQA